MPLSFRNNTYYIVIYWGAGVHRPPIIVGIELKITLKVNIKLYFFFCFLILILLLTEEQYYISLIDGAGLCDCHLDDSA